MTSTIRFGLCCLCLLLLPNAMPGQGANRIKEEAKTYFAAEHYADALRTFQRSRSLMRSDEESRFLMAICHYQLNGLDEALELLLTLTQEERSPYPECWWYLGRIYHDQNRFTEAVNYFKLYLRSLRPEDDKRPMVVEAIRRCDNAQRLWYQEREAVVENLGPGINTEGDEFGPVLSPNRATQLYFSSARVGTIGGPRDRNARPDEQFGHPLSDMFTTRLQGGQWQAAEPLHYLLNSPQNDVLLGFDGQGAALIYFQGWALDRGEIYVDTFQAPDERSLRTNPLLSPIVPQAGENSLFVYQDTLIIFAARRPDGYGGFDLYQTSFRDGRWTLPRNLGPEVNSAFDETSPFLCRDGRTLYYSTNDSRRSVGGLDVVRNVYIPQAARWSPTENLGFPINSAADDSHFRLARDGFTGFLASARKDGFGQRDLYVVYFSTYRPEMEPAPVVVASALPPPTTLLPATTLTDPPPATTVADPPPISQPVLPEPTPPPPAPPAAAWAPIDGPPSQWTNLAPASTSVQRAVAKLLEQPGSRLILSAYLPGQPTTEELFAAARAAEAVAIQLQSTNRFAADRFYVRALAYSGATPQLGISLTITEGVPPEDWPVIGQAFTPPPSIAPANQVLCFKVQVVSVQRTYDNASLLGETGLMLEKGGDSPYYRYTVGAATTVSEAQALRRSLVREGFSGAYLVPYLYGERINNTRARQMSSRFTELGNYLDR